MEGDDQNYKWGAFEEMIARRPYIVLDGGMSNELEALGIDLNTKLWTASALFNDPEKVLSAHKAFVSAGADIITTCSYQASFPGFDLAGIPNDQQVSLMAKSVELARQSTKCCGQMNRTVLVAASIGPYAAYLADGSEYRGYSQHELADEDFISFHKPRLECLLSSKPDVIAIETIPVIREALIVSRILKELSPNTPAWVTFSISPHSDLKTAGGESLADAFKTIAAEANVLAVGVNCCSPRKPSLEDIVKLIPDCCDKVIICYPNKGEKWDPTTKSWIKNGNLYDGQRAVELYRAGVKIIGGCCQVGPDVIRDISECLSRE